MGTIKERKAKDKIVFDAEVRHRGYPNLYRTFERCTDAKIWIQDIETCMRSGRYLPQAEAQRHTLAEAIDRFVVEELPKKPRNYRDQKREVLWFKSAIGTKLLSEVPPSLLNEQKLRFLQGETRFKRRVQPQTWNRYLSSISCVFQLCVHDWEWMDYNPARRVRREREAPGRVRFLTDNERERLLEACKTSWSENLYPMVVLALSTGMRRGELIGLTWEQVDLAKATIILTHTKNGEPRRVPVRGLALDCLRAHAKVMHEFTGHKWVSLSKRGCRDLYNFVKLVSKS